MPAVKADAYGHGAVRVARELESWGVEWLCVSSAREALELRAAGIACRILVMIPVRNSIPELIGADIDLTVADSETLDLIVAAKADRPARVHLKVDTGMGRLGHGGASARRLAARAASLGQVEPVAVWTHFACADDADSGYTERQLAIFGQLLADLERDGTRPPLVHAANSAALLNYPDSHFDLARPGIALYGYPPGPYSSAAQSELTPALAVRSTIVFVKRVPPGTSISYGATWRSPAETTIATVQHGYADGYFRALGGLAEANLAGRRVKVVGRVCMDQLMIDIGDEVAAPGDEVTLLGPGGPTAAELAGLVGSIPYEVLTSIGRRVEREYLV